MSDSVPDSGPFSQLTVPGWRIEYVEQTGSTNLLAAERIRLGLAGADHGLGHVVVTGHQTAGRGRLDRMWETPAGVALTFSAVIDPRRPDADWPWLPLLTGVAVAEAVQEVSGLHVGLKWPNDVLVEGRKLAGILVERIAGPTGPLAVVGVGINVHQTTLPVPNATSLAIEGVPADLATLLEAILRRFTEHVASWGEPGVLYAAYSKLCVTLGNEVAVQLPGDRSLEGMASEVDGQGHLIVTNQSGRHVVRAGDVVHVRPTT